jgi:hypothetical protein
VAVIVLSFGGRGALEVATPSPASFIFMIPNEVWNGTPVLVAGITSMEFPWAATTHNAWLCTMMVCIQARHLISHQICDVLLCEWFQAPCSEPHGRQQPASLRARRVCCHARREEARQVIQTGRLGCRHNLSGTCGMC